MIDLKSHFDKIKYPGTIRDLFHTFWIFCENKSRKGQENVERESNYFDPQNLRTWRDLLEFLCLAENTEQKNSFRRTNGTDTKLCLLQGRISGQKGWCFLQLPCALSVINNKQFTREGTEVWFQR